MRLLDIFGKITLTEAGGFAWASGADEELYRSLNGLVKYNSGLYKSTKQAAYIKKHYGWSGPSNSLASTTSLFRSDASQLKNFFGIDLKPGQKAISAEATMSWSAYGGNAMRPINWFFTLDEFGVTAKYKIKYKGNMRDGTGPDPSKTELEWTRPAETDTSSISSELQSAAKQKQQDDAVKISIANASKHTGAIGAKVKGAELTVVGSWGPKYGDYGSYYVNRLRDAQGNSLLNFGRSLGQAGDKIKINYTVKKHDISDLGPDGHEQITIIGRAKILDAQLESRIPPTPAKDWVWVQPRTDAELVKRLRDASEYGVPGRERENLCAVAAARITALLNQKVPPAGS